LKKNKVKLIIVLFIAIVVILILISFLNKNYNNSKKNGNNISIKEIEKTILNINSYKTELDVTIKSNKNENKYKLYQEVKNGREMQKVIDPDYLKGTEIIYENGKLQIKNTKINVSKFYENYPNIANNVLFLSDFMRKFNKSDNKEIKEKENQIIFKLKNGAIYNQEQILTIEKGNQNDDNLKITMKILDSNNNTRIYIIYSKIEFDI
jgi:hypothetical protein